MTLGSLFDGSGTAPLAARMCGIEPVWCSEIEPFPIAVTRARFPQMKHYGNICDIKGDEVEPVDIICGGSPCQDLSVAGKRAGLEGGERSVLFHEQIRIIKEMRNATNDIRPRFAIWENVPGAYSSNKGEDFRCVLEAFCKIADETADIPRPAEGRWAAAGCIVGNGWSVAYRTLDAQYFGVPQRRRRIFLVADFGSECAAEILSEQSCLHGDIAESGETRESAAGKVEGGVGEASGVVSKGNGECWLTPDKHMALSTGGGQAGQGYPCAIVPTTLEIRSGCEGGGKGALIQTDLSGTLGCNNDQTLFEPICYGICSDGSKSMLSDNPNSGIYIADTARTLDGNGGNPSCNQGGIAVVEPIGIKCMTSWDTQTRRVYDPSGVYPSLCSGHDSGQNQQSIIEPQYFENHGQDERYTGPHDIASCVTAGYGMGGSTKPFIVSPDPIKVLPFNERQITSPQNGNNPDYGDPCHTLSATDGAPTICVQGSVIGRADHNGPQGSGISEDVSFTLNTIDRHAVCFDCRNLKANDELSATLQTGTDLHSINPVMVETYQDTVGALCSADYKDVGNQYVSQDKCIVTRDIVRRLVPRECAKLQGFPPDWCSNISVPNPTESDISFWQGVWDTYQSINGKKPKSVKQIITWLKHPHSDSAEYKMWGNGMALPCVLYIMRGIISAERPIT